MQGFWDVLEEKQKEYREILYSELKNGLTTLVNYSKIELEKYYTLGLIQTQKSHNYSMIAMWIGFATIIFGIVTNTVDLIPYIVIKNPDV